MENYHKSTLGVIGGLGPMATAYFMELVTCMTDALVDQDHLEMIVHSSPSIPDRTSYILDRSKPNPLPQIIDIGNRLAAAGAKWIAIPCITAHYFYDTLEAEISAQIINGIEETVLHLKKNGVTKVGIMATDGTITTGLFQKELNTHGIEAIVPAKANQANVMHLIYENIKASRPVEMELFHAVSDELRKNGAQAIILGCTELALIKRDYEIGPGYIDAMEVLAQQAVVRCGGNLKNEYKCLISH